MDLKLGRILSDGREGADLDILLRLSAHQHHYLHHNAFPSHSSAI